jgi:hypothetical protein
LTSGTEVGAAGEPTRATGPARTRTQPEAIVDTAEIQPVAPSRPRRISSPYEHAFEEPERREPAPMGLQILVWLLFVVFVIGLVGLAVEHFHPSWITFLRHTIPAKNAPARHHHSASSTSTTSHSTNNGTLTLTSSTAKGATYSVPTSSAYTLVVSVPNRCYIDVVSPPGSKNYVFFGTIDTQQSPKSIQVTGSSALLLGARTTSVAVDVAGKQVGKITPQVGYTYTFVPTGH